MANKFIFEGAHHLFGKVYWSSCLRVWSVDIRHATLYNGGSIAVNMPTGSVNDIKYRMMTDVENHAYLLGDNRI